MSSPISVKENQKLYNEVVQSGLCVLCGACVGFCPYFGVNPLRGTIQAIDHCDLDEGQCYRYCPRTATDIDAIYRRLFGVPYDEDKAGIGIVRDIFLARSKDTDILQKAQDGGVVTTLLWTAVKEGIIDGAVETKMNDDKFPSGFLARDKEELLQCAGNSYEPGATLEALNRIPRESKEKLGVVGLPCQTTVIGEMKTYPPRNRANIENVKVVVGLFCGWSFSPGAFQQFLKENFDLSQVVKFDIPHHPGHTLDVYSPNGKKSVELDEIRKLINPACSYCGDMTSQFADISVGSGRAKFRGWNTVIVRTDAGANLVEIAMKMRLLETQPIPEENQAHLREAALNKMKRAIRSITGRTGSTHDLGYLEITPKVLDKLLKG